VSFRLVPNSVTLNDLEGVTSLRDFTELGSFRGALRKVVEDTPYFLRQKCSKKCSFIICGDIRSTEVFLGSGRYDMSFEVIILKFWNNVVKIN